MPKNSADIKRKFSIDGKNFLFAFTRDCKTCGAAVGILSSKEPVSRYNVNALRKNLEKMFSNAECPYCTTPSINRLRTSVGTPTLYKKISGGLFSSDSVVYLIKCKKHGHLRIFVKGKKDVGFAQVRNERLKGSAGKFSKAPDLPRAKPQICPICGEISKVDMHEVSSSSASIVNGVVADFHKAMSEHVPIKSPLLHPTDERIKRISMQVLDEAIKPNNKTKAMPGTGVLLDWMSKNITPGMLKGFGRNKFIRSDLEVLDDREANGIEYCLLFYSIARNIDIDCTFGISDVNVQGVDENLSSVVYTIFAQEGNTEVTILPGGVFSGVMTPETQIQERIDIREFLRRIHLLSKSEVFTAMKTIPLLYHVGKGAAWLYRPEPNALSFIVTRGKDPVLEFKYILEKEGGKRIKCTLVDFENKIVLTSSKADDLHFLLKKPEGFRVLFTSESEAILARARNLLGPEMANVFFADDMAAVLNVFESRAMKHYDYSYG